MFILLLAVVLSVQAPNEPKLATVDGIVTHAASQTPIRKAKVTLSPLGSSSGSVSVETADDGKFSLKDVKPGRYRLQAEKAGYASTFYSSRRGSEAAWEALRIDPGAALTGLTVGLPKYGIISGKTVDSDGEPVSKVLVMAISDQYLNGKRTRLPRGTIPVLTNDLGEYRIGELPPGKYIICAVPVTFYQPAPPGADTKPAAEDSSITACFPSLPQMSEATPLEIKDSSEVPGIDVRLIKSKTVTVQGRVSGMPANAGMVAILNLNNTKFGPLGNAMNPRALMQGTDGKFEFKNVPPGSYVIHTLPTGLGNMPFVVKANVEIGDQPVVDLTVPALIPFDLKARVNAEPGPELKLPSVRIILTPADEITSTVATGTPNADGDLILVNAVPGKQKVNIAGLPLTHYVKEIRLGDRLVDGDIVEIVNASEPLQVTLAVGPGEVAGLVRNDKGEPMGGMMVVAIPEPRRPFRLRATRSDQNGMYRIPNLPPGEYLLLAPEPVEQGQVEDEEFLKPMLSKAKKVKVEGGAQSMELNVTPSAR